MLYIRKGMDSRSIFSGEERKAAEFDGDANMPSDELPSEEKPSQIW